MKYQVPEYCICEAYHKDDLEAKVQFLMPAGWRPTGGLTVTRIGDPGQSLSLLYSQALYREIEHHSEEMIKLEYLPPLCPPDKSYEDRGGQ